MFNIKFREQLLAVPGLYEELDGLYKRLSAFLKVSHNDDGTLIQEAPTQASELGIPVGTIIPFAGAGLPAGWLRCDGTAYSRATYSTLYTAIGTAWGVGDGATTFNVPDLRQRFPLGVAASGTGATLGATGGSIDHTHTGPSHTHTSATVNVTVSGATAVSTSPTDAAGAGNTGATNPPFAAVHYLILYA
jgi:microcystin-dependent protein